MRKVLRTIEFKGTGADFSPSTEAQAWAARHGFCVGFMCGLEPRGLMRGPSLIAKWRNLSQDDKERLEGVMTGNGRTGPVLVELYVETGEA